MRTIVKIVLLASLFILAADSTSQAELATSVDVWLVSTRHLPVVQNLPENALNLSYQRLAPDGELIDSTAEEFKRSESADVPTSVFVHGAPADISLVLDSARKLSQQLLLNAPPGSHARIVVWTWPSDKICRRMLADLRIKGQWAEYQGYYLARFINGIDPDVRLALVGYSFGARTVGTALHLLGGGGFPDGSSLEAPLSTPRKQPLDVAFLAAGIDTYWLQPDARYSEALSSVRHALVTTNACDPVLKRYHLLCGLRGGPSALGFTGIYDVSALGPYADIYEEIDVSAEAGSSHDLFQYLNSAPLLNRLVEMIFSQPEDPQP